MRIVIITQDDPFYVSKNINYLLEILPKGAQVVGCVVNDVSPFGKQECFLKKAKKTFDIFGLKFFLYYTFKYIFNKLTGEKLDGVLKRFKIDNIKLSEHINHPNSVKVIQKYKPDLLISILGNQIFKKPIINLAPKGCLNLHTALLPEYRGLMPTFWVMKNKETHTGVTVFFVDEGIDSGPIIVQKRVEIGNKTQQELISMTKKIGMEAIAESIKLIQTDKVTLVENDVKKKTYFSFPARDDVKEFLKKGNKFF